MCTNFTEKYIDCLKGKMPMDAVIDDRESPKPEDDDQSQVPSHNIPMKHHPSASMMLNMSNHQSSINHHKTELRDESHPTMQPLSIPSMTSRHTQPLLGKLDISKNIMVLPWTGYPSTLLFTSFLSQIFIY